MKKTAFVAVLIIAVCAIAGSFVGCENLDTSGLEEGIYICKYYEVEPDSEYVDLDVSSEDYITHYYNSKVKVSFSDNKIVLQNTDSQGKEYQTFSLKCKVKYGILTTEKVVNKYEYSEDSYYYELYNDTLVYVYRNESKNNTSPSFTSKTYYKLENLPQVAEETVDVEGKTYNCNVSSLYYDQSAAVEGDNEDTDTMTMIHKHIFADAKITFDNDKVKIYSLNYYEDGDYGMDDAEYSYTREGNVLTLVSDTDYEDDDIIGEYKIYLTENGLVLIADYLRIPDFWSYSRIEFDLE